MKIPVLRNSVLHFPLKNWTESGVIGDKNDLFTRVEIEPSNITFIDINHDYFLFKLLFFALIY